MMILCRALVAAVLLRAVAAMKIVEDPEDRLDVQDSSDMEDSRSEGPGRKHRRRRAPGPPPPTPEPTRAPTPYPTPEPTYTMELPGVACLCKKPACFEQFDLNNDTCITYGGPDGECELQWFLAGNCSSNASHPAAYEDGTPYGPPVWDQDGDGCINYTEWEIIYDVTNGSVCPQEAPTICEECETGYVLETDPCECVCCHGETRRRRSLECTPCPAPFVPCCNDKDECCDPYKPGARDLPNNSINITVDAPTLQVCDPWEVGDKITIEGNPPGDTSTVITHEATVMAVTQVYNPDGYTLEILPPLSQDFSPINSEVAQTCTTTDGTQVSASYSPFYGGCCCTCGTTPPTDCCESTEVCTVYENGTGVCTPAGPYPEFSTPAPTVGAKGDPHLVNLQGEHFDINHEGKFTLLRFPQAAEKPAEFSLQAGIQADVGKPCTTYITQVELSGSWLGSKSVQIRCYRKSHTNGTDAFLGARLLEGDSDSPWQTIEEFESKDLVLSDSESDIEVSLDKATWFPKKGWKKGPNVAGMFSLLLRNKKSPNGAKITMRQDLPDQEHLNVAVRQLSQLGRVDVGGLLGFDAHPESLERPSAACVHHRATARYRIESQDEADHGYYFRPTWKDRWDKVRGRPRDNEAGASLRVARGTAEAEGTMCKCPSEDSGFSGSIEGVIVDSASFVFAEASWE